MIIKIQPRGNSSCRASRRINHLAPPWFYISGLLNCERINLCWATKFLINSYTSPRELMHHSRYENRHMRRWKCSPCILSSNLLHAEIPQNVLESQWKQAMLSLVIIWSLKDFLGFPVGWMVKKKKKIHLPMQETQVWSPDWEDAGRRKEQPTPIFLPEKSHGQRSLMGYRQWGHKESDTTWQLNSRRSKRLPSSLHCFHCHLLWHLVTFWLTLIFHFDLQVLLILFALPLLFW